MESLPPEIQFISSVSQGPGRTGAQLLLFHLLHLLDLFHLPVILFFMLLLPQVLSLQRNVFCSKREEQGIKDHKVPELLRVLLYLSSSPGARAAVRGSQVQHADLPLPLRDIGLHHAGGHSGQVSWLPLHKSTPLRDCNVLPQVGDWSLRHGRSYSSILQTELGECPASVPTSILSPVL